METDTICLILFLCPVPNSPDDNDLLQLDLDSMCSWSVYWSLKFNAEKSFLLGMSRKRKPSEYTYIISGAPISITDSHRDLGVVVSNNLKWSVHVAHCTSTANCMLGFLRMNCAQMFAAGGYFTLRLLDLTFPTPASSEHHKALDANLPF